MNLVYYRMSSFLFFYLPLLFEPGVNAHCTGIYGEGLHVGLVRTWFRRLPVMRSAVGGWVDLSAICKGNVILRWHLSVLQNSNESSVAAEDELERLNCNGLL